MKIVTALPMENFGGFFAVAVDGGDVAGTAWHDFGIELDARHFFKSIDHLQDGDPIAAPEIESVEMFCIFLIHNVLQGQYVGVCDVGDVQVIADARAVSSVVVVAENLQLLAFSAGDLCHDGDQVVGRVVRQFAILARHVGSDGVEIAQGDAVQLGMYLREKVDHLFANLFRVGVRTKRDAHGRLFADGEFSNIAINGAGRGENEVGDLKFVARLQYVLQGVEIVAIVFQRFCHGFGNRLESCKVNDGFYVGVLFENRKEFFFFTDVNVVVFDFGAADFPDAFLGARI